MTKEGCHYHRRLAKFIKQDNERLECEKARDELTMLNYDIKTQMRGKNNHFKGHLFKEEQQQTINHGAFMGHEGNKLREMEQCMEQRMQLQWKHDEDENETLKQLRSKFFGIDELNTLEVQLQSLYAAKFNALHAKQKEYVKKKEQMEIQETHRKLNACAEQEKHDHLKAIADRKAQQLKYRHDLDRQRMEQCTNLRSDVIYDVMSQKQHIDEIVRQVESEMRCEQEKKINSRNTLRRAFEDTLRAREACKDKEAALEAKEERCIEKFLTEREKRDLLHQEQALKRAEQKRQFAQAWAAKVEKEKRKEEALWELTQELEREESKADARDYARDYWAKFYANKQKLKDEKQEDLLRAATKMHQEQEEKRKVVEKMQAQFALAAEHDQVERDKRKQRDLDHAQDLVKMIEERKVRDALEIQRIRKEYCDAKRTETMRQEAFEKERLKLLRQHVPNLAGFLPKGMLTEGDLENLGPEFRRVYRKALQDAGLHFV